MTVKSKRPASIDEAIKLLDDALGGNTDDLKDLVSDELQTFKTELADLSSQLTMDAISARLTKLGTEALTRSQEFMTEATTEINSQVRKNPWPAIGGVAVGTFALGFLLGKNSLRSDGWIDPDDDDAVADARAKELVEQ